MRRRLSPQMGRAAPSRGGGTDLQIAPNCASGRVATPGYALPRRTSTLPLTESQEGHSLFLWEIEW